MARRPTAGTETAFGLDTALDDSDALTQLLEPYLDDALKAYEVSRLVNSASNDIPEVATPATDSRN